jgi:hypothetical protein
MPETHPADSPELLPRCPRAPEAADYARDELAPAARAAFEAHLTSCEPCRELAADFQNVVSTLKSAPALPADETFAPHVLKAALDAEARRNRTARYLQLAAGLAILLGGGLLIAHRPPPASHAPALATATPVPAPSDLAVAQALDWLIRSQEPSGGWDASKWQGRKEYEVGLTGMALLALVRQENEATDRTRCTSTIRRATEYLLRQQDTSGAFGATTDTARMYNHGIATVALLEAARTDQAPQLRTALIRAIDFIKQQQLDSGGWGYVNRNGEQANTSVSVWQLQALQLATTRQLPDASVAYRRGLRWLGGVVDGRGSFGYQQQGDTPDNNDTLTAMGAFCLLDSQHTPENPSADPSHMNQALQGAAVRWDKETDFYRWFFLAQALRAAGGHEFQHSLKRLQDSLLATRNQEGAVAGSWDPTGTWSPVAGRVFTTAMATLCL